MSGIVAIMSLDGRPIPPELPRAQLAAIAHRGEWEPRLWEAPGIALGHVNLPRTPEAEREFLPAPDLTGRYWLTWDGRLDNRDELARKLGYDSAQGAEKTDADYVLDAFVNWGDDCVHHLLGDWAVVIWDNQARRLFCAKDPIGWRQLYYAEHDGLLAVGSEPQQFFANGWLPRVVREEYLLRYLAGAPQQAGEMWLVGITELSGGRSMCQGASAKTAPTKTFYRVNRARGPKSIDEAIDGVDFHLDRAVKARLRSNRPVGVMLSGGLDSSTVAHAARSSSRVPLVAVTAFAPSFPEMDERRHSRSVAGKLGLRCVEVDIDEAWPLSSTLLPTDSITSPSHPPHAPAFTLLASATRREGLGVTLGGEGGDEWMTGGYLAGLDACLADAVLRGRLREARSMAAVRGKGRRALVRATYEQALPRRFQRLFEAIGRPPRHPERAIVNCSRIAVPDPNDAKRPVWQRSQNERVFWGAFRDAEFRSQLAWRDRHLWLAGGVEHRAPFNHLPLVEFMHSVPEWMKQYHGTKWLLRGSLHRRGLPEIARRRDNGILNGMFQTGVAEREINRVQRVSKLLTTLDGINSQAVHAEVNRWLGVRDTNIRTLWRIVSVGSWVESELSQHASNAFAALDEFRQGKEVIDNAEDSLHSAVR